MDPQPRGPRYECCKRVYVKTDHAAKDEGHERIPLECREKMALKKLNSASRHSARDARQVSKIVEHAVRPRQPEC